MLIAASLESLPEPRNIAFFSGRGTSCPSRAASSISLTLKMLLLAWMIVLQLYSIAATIRG
jgi:hypothetical protein